jgi:hypothetical protein
VSARIRAGSKFKLFLCSVLIDAGCLLVPVKMSSSIPGGYAYPRLKTTDLNHIDVGERFLKRITFEKFNVENGSFEQNQEMYKLKRYTTPIVYLLVKPLLSSQNF